MSVLTRCYTRDSELVTRNVAGETIIVPIKSNVGDLDSIYTLNEVGSTIWELIDGKNSVNQIIYAVHNAYEVTHEEAEQDTIEFLRAVEEAGLIKRAKD
jgi:transposase-like protein